MHSREWRLAYARHLPPHLTCRETAQQKTFHFANGASTDSKAIVFRIPIIVGNRRGEVLSAEIPTGNTPLLLSISAMEALDMVLRLREREV